MNYIFVATKAEAQAFIDYFQPKVKRFNDIFLELNSQIVLIRSGIGIAQSLVSIQKTKNHFAIQSHDRVINVGIAAAPKEFAIGSLHRVKEVLYHDKRVQIAHNGVVCESVDSAQKEQKRYFVDMESFAFAKSFDSHNLFIYKVVSDHFEPQSISKDFAKKLIFQNIETVIN